MFAFIFKPNSQTVPSTKDTLTQRKGRARVPHRSAVGGTGVYTMEVPHDNNGDDTCIHDSIRPFPLTAARGLHCKKDNNNIDHKKFKLHELSVLAV